MPDINHTRHRSDLLRGQQMWRSFSLLLTCEVSEAKIALTKGKRSIITMNEISIKVLNKQVKSTLPDGLLRHLGAYVEKALQSKYGDLPRHGGPEFGDLRGVRPNSHSILIISNHFILVIQRQ
jgi:hypothetical protein